MATKTDNHNPQAKLDLRRYFLRKYHSDGQPIRVFDCCQGSGLLWRKLREEFKVASYWGVDVKPKAGRLKIESQRVLSQAGMVENIIDVDTYGTPWKHWSALLPNILRPTTVFLTMGRVFTGGALPLSEAEAIGLRFPTLKCPGSFTPKLCDFAVPYLLNNGQRYTTITEAVEAVSAGNARYIGLRLEPLNANSPESSPPSRSTRKPKQAVKEPAHVC